MVIYGKPYDDKTRIWVFVCGLLAASHGMPAQTGKANREALPIQPDTAATKHPPYVPMTGQERVRLYIKNTLNPIEFLSAGGAAGIGQWRDRPDAWGEGGKGYAKRYASAYVEHLERQTLLSGFSSAFHEDNRYVASGLTGAGARVKYAVANSFLARHDDGTKHFSWSRVIAFAGAAALSRMWQPRGNRGMGGAVANLGTSLSVAVGFNVGREFLPQILH